MPTGYVRARVGVAVPTEKLNPQLTPGARRWRRFVADVKNTICFQTHAPEALLMHRQQNHTGTCSFAF